MADLNPWWAVQYQDDDGDWISVSVWATEDGAREERDQAEADAVLDPDDPKSWRVAKAWIGDARLRAVEAERDRLREALEKIAGLADIDAWEETKALAANTIARRALASTGQEPTP